MSVSSDLRQASTPEPRRSHPPFCDPRLCVGFADGGFAHRSTGAHVGSTATGVIEVFASRFDDGGNLPDVDRTGIEHVVLTFAVSTVWSAQWLLPHDDADATAGIDLLHVDAGRVGWMLINLGEGAKHCPRHRFEPARIHTTTGDDIAGHGARVVGSNGRLVAVTVSTSNLWSGELGEFPRSEVDAPLCLLLAADDAVAIGQALIHAAGEVAPR